MQEISLINLPLSVKVYFTMESGKNPNQNKTIDYCEIKFTYPYLENRILKFLERTSQRIGMTTFGVQLAIFQERKNYQQK